MTGNRVSNEQDPGTKRRGILLHRLSGRARVFIWVAGGDPKVLPCLRDWQIGTGGRLDDKAAMRTMCVVGEGEGEGGVGIEGSGAGARRVLSPPFAI